MAGRQTLPPTPPNRIEANRDLANAQQIDFSEDVKEWLVQIGGNARKVWLRES